MLNVLVEKAIERSSQSKLEDHQPIFAISYSVASPNEQKNKDHRSKTVNVNKIPKIVKATEIISQRWKTKTIQKLQNIQIQTTNTYPFKTSKNSQKSSTNIQDPNKVDSNHQTVPIKSIHLSPIEYDSYIDDLRNITQAPFMVKKKKLQSKNHTMYDKFQDRQFGNSLYMRYRQGLKNKTNSKVAFNKYYHQQRRVSEGDMHNCQVVNTEQSENNNNVNSENKPKKKKNVGFINTIQYKTLPKQQVRLYKIDNSEKERSRRSSIGQTLGIFIRTKKQSYGKNSPELMNMAISAFTSNQQQQKTTQSNLLSPQSPKDLQTRGMNISVRKVYTQKRTRKNFKDLQIEDLRQQFKSNSKRETYRPWSPIRANPPLFDYDLMISQSRRQNIQIEEVQYE